VSEALTPTETVLLLQCCLLMVSGAFLAAEK